MNDFVLAEEPFFNTGKMIMLTFLVILIIFVGYLFFANKAIADNGGFKKKKVSKKSSKGKEVWSYGD